MKVGAVPESWIEAVALATGLAPTPVIDSLATAGLSRVLMVATKVGVFEALADGAHSAARVAAKCGTHPEATRKLLFALAGSGYLEWRDEGATGEKFALTAVARKWLLSSSVPSLRDHMLLMEVVWRWLEHYETFVRTGRALDVHRDLQPPEWELYQRGMRSLAGLLAREVALRTPVPRGATSMLDVGGSHGYFSVALCRRHPGLRSVVVDLPEAIAHAGPLLAAEGMGDRVVHRPGDARTADLGDRAHDVIFIANLVHHFSDTENRDLCARAARALRPGGVLVIQEIIRPETPGDAGGMGALGDLYFAALSDSGTWSWDEIAAWQTSAGLRTMSPIKMLTAPGVGQQVGKNPNE